MWINESSSDTKLNEINLFKISDISFNLKTQNSLTNNNQNNKYDIIIGNPPYGQNKLEKNIREKIFELWEEVYTIGSKKSGQSYNPSAAFIERSGEAGELKMGGWVGFPYRFSKALFGPQQRIVHLVGIV